MRLTRPLILERADRLPDGAGGFSETWEALGVLWADVAPRAGRQMAAPVATVSQMSYRIMVRGAPQSSPQRPVPGQRFRDGARVFHIRAVTEAAPLAHFLICFCDEEVAA
uniref:head-tail adaptor protein n=1 Tax=Palleronia aestuarii TaxID=568105 RepID=UPI0027E490C9|nr:head-tail adaptor protein [Palleronia aestuarii]